MVSTNRGCMVISLFHLTFTSDHARDYCFVVLVFGGGGGGGGGVFLFLPRKKNS